MNNVYAVILAGGRGIRLWPLSGAQKSKHLLSLDGTKTLLQQTTERLLKEIPPNQIIIVTHKDHAAEAQKQLKEIHSGFIFLIEPKRCNTLPAAAWATRTILKKNKKAVIGVFPADHIIQDDKNFLKALKEAAPIAEKNYVVTLGIKPTRPETGYGYLHAKKRMKGKTSALQLQSFSEKPDLETAQFYLNDGNYYWNAGMFIFKGSTFEKELKRHQSEIFKAFQGMTNCDMRPVYSKLPNISIDYGIMEKLKKGAVIPVDMGWSDVGSWESLYQTNRKDKNQNVFQGDVLAHQTGSSLVIADKGPIAVIGLENVVIVQKGNSILVSSRNHLHLVKDIVSHLEEKTKDKAP